MTPQEQEMNDRLVRIETRLAQLMLHLGLNPNERVYSHPNPHPPLADKQGCVKTK